MISILSSCHLVILSSQRLLLILRKPNMFTIRPFRPTAADYNALVAIHTATWPDERPITVAMCRQNDEDWNPQYLNQRFIVETEGLIVATGGAYEAFWQYTPGVYYIDLGVHPDYLAQGVADLLYEHIMTAVAGRVPTPETLVMQTREDKQEWVQFLIQRNFQPTMRYPKSALSIARFDPAKFAGVQEQVAAPGIRIYTLGELYNIEPQWKDKLYELRWALIQDVPAVDPPTKVSMADFERMVLEDPALCEEAFFVAVDATATVDSGVGPFVGMSNLWLNDPTRQRLDTGLTGVVRSHRRKGIATA